MAKKNESGLSENVAGLLCYLPYVGWLIGIVFLVIDKRKFVRFHALQSLIVSGILLVISFILGGIYQSMAMAAVSNPIGFGMTMATGGIFLVSALWFITTLVNFIAFVLWILLMYKAYKGEKYKLPLVGNLAEKYA